jgi:hypothetical protein
MIQKRDPNDMAPWEKHVIAGLTCVVFCGLLYIIARLIIFILHLIGA